MKLVRPLHRQRRRRRARWQVLNAAELSERFGVPLHELETTLVSQGIDFYKDSQDNIWASVEQPVS